jgi:molybdenum cofactor cytidylyltransferase
MREVAAIILAAGQGTRFVADPQDSKLLALLEGRPLIRHVAEAACSSAAQPVRVVTGHAAAAVEAALADLPLRFVHNAEFASGLASSLKVGIAALPPQTAGALILLADMPRISAGLINRLVTVFEDAADAPLAVLPTYLGRCGNPVLVGRQLFSAIENLTGDRGARIIIEQQKTGVLECPLDDASIELDVDTLDELQQIEHSRG